MKNKKEVFLTKQGLEEVAVELDNLKQNVRPEVIQQIKEARAQGDLSENAEYHSARDRQGQVEARIKELEYLLDNATIIEETKSDVVTVGSKVKIKYVDDDEEEEYSIVGSTEADPFENKISNESPIAKVIMGKKKGDTVTVESPNGSYEIKIVSIN
ncbi:MAG: transcription elongation factor GreA [Bacilli bacterium]|nr:transcription elongation factor GreA [Bacilli bacterium]